MKKVGFKIYSVAWASLLVSMLASGCSKMTEVEGVQCIKTVDIAAIDLECNWEKYNSEQKFPSAKNN